MRDCPTSVHVALDQTISVVQSVFHPVKLEIVQENLYVHHKKFKKDIATILSDSAGQDFFGAGFETGNLLKMLFKHHVPIKAIPFFAAGLIYEFVEDNNLVHIE